jgi:hypothetical protein
MKKLCVLFAILFVGITVPMSVKARETNFSLKNNSDRTILVRFNDRAAKALGAFEIKPGSEKSMANPNINLIEKMTVRYCDGPTNTSCVCEEDDFGNTVCGDYKYAYYTVKFTPAQNPERTFHLKFDLMGRGAIGRKPVLEAQKGRFGKLTSALRNNITNDEIEEVELTHVNKK